MSSKSHEGKELYDFGEFRLDPRARLLLKDGIPVSLTPKSFDVLLHLVRNAGKAVSREELLSVVWPGTVVTDASLTQAVFLVRKALEEAEAGPRFVETVPRVGYRFDFPAGAAGEEAEPIGPSDAGTIDRPGAEPGGPREAEPLAAPEELTIGPPRAGRRPWVPRLLLGAGAALLGLAIVLLVPRWTGRGVRPPAPSPAPAAGAPRLTLVREVAVPPDAERVLGVVDGTVVLGAPGATYLLPLDGALAPPRIPLAPGEVAAGTLVGESMVVLREGHVFARHALKKTEADLGPLPGDDAGPPDLVLVSPTGRSLGVVRRRGLEVFERTDRGWTLRLRDDAPFAENEAVALTERFAARVAGGRSVRAWRLPSGERVLDAPFAEQRPQALAVEDATGRVAVGGAFDGVVVFAIGSGAAPLRIPRRGWTEGLAFVPDRPTLLVSGFADVAAWRDGPGVVASLKPSGPAGALAATSDALLVLVPRRQRLAVISYDGLPRTAPVAASGAPLWAMEHDASGATVFAGGKDGKLHVLDVASRAVRAVDVHTDGIPSMTRDGDLLATSSDDKTVAVWKLPGPTLSLRTKAHAFLVNDLSVVDGAGGSRELVTSSSDGTIRRWSWPALELLESVDVARTTGRAEALHALWAAPGGRRLVVGTWSGALLDLSRQEAGWSVRRIPVRSRAVYRLTPLPAIGALLVVGILPSEVLLYDLAAGTLVPLESAGIDAFWSVPGPGGVEAVVAGLGGVARYSFRREGKDASASGAVRYQVRAAWRTGAGFQTATLLPDGTLWTGTVGGSLVPLPPESLDGPPLAAGAVGERSVRGSEASRSPSPGSSP